MEGINLRHLKLTLHNFNSDVQSEKICQPGVDYQVHETDVAPEEALTFFDRLIRPRDGFYLETAERLLGFWRNEGAIWVEITSAEFRATSEVSLTEAQAVIETLARGGEFTSRVPSKSSAPGRPLTANLRLSSRPAGRSRR